ncbi:hypothetical protein Nepgr_027085 [Nepenthes gracilis]|uniref:Histone-lysine N-methyltransferase SUVR5 n=1 Tax=Nepenthes gracilis TaxID=150966 RepID=A0AAD3Y0Y6_NEPGR|nr:hypothetical protein Nepgr_027085 [Nepenthes gracilis]
MEVIACSNLRHAEESDCSQQKSLMDLVYDGKSNCHEHAKRVQLADHELNHFVLNPNLAREGIKCEALGPVADELCSPEGRDNGSSCCDLDVNSQKISGDFHELDDDKEDIESHDEESCAAFENSQVIVDTIESDMPSENKDEESSPLESKWPDKDEALALWVKWRGKWQAGIKCVRADWPLATVKAKPTHDRKNYIVIFFPHSRNYSWADTLLVCSINEFPQPIVHKSHKVGVLLVKDLTVARRFIMQKLAVGMLNIIDQLHLQVLIETARDVIVWKEFATEASRCKGYPDLGRMLLKLQNMLLQRYINAGWLQDSFNSWVKRCQNALSAESIELLKEELEDSILWNEVNSLQDVQGQPALGSEWKTWKHEVMKLFSTSHPNSCSGDLEQLSKNDVDRNNNSPLTNLQLSRKRPKLEVRRAEPHSSIVQNQIPRANTIIEIDSQFFVGRSTPTSVSAMPSALKEESHRDGAAPISPLGCVPNRWDDIVVHNSNTEPINSKDVGLRPMNRLPEMKSSYLVHKSRQCKAFIEAKGRHCVRWANDGDDYCCVHLASRFSGSTTRAEGTPVAEAPMCEGITTLGTKCKHHSLYGSSFCKKHRPRDEVLKNTGSPEYQRKRNHEEHVSMSETTYYKEEILAGENQKPLLVEPISAVEAETFDEGNSLFKMPLHFTGDCNSTGVPHCIGLDFHEGGVCCLESPKRHSLYCEKHIPSWLKRARNGKSRIISKEVFVDLLMGCPSQEHKVCLHQACELFYKLFKSILSLRNQVPREIQFQWALSEASKDLHVAEFLMKLVSSEKERLRRIWGFGFDKDEQVSSSAGEEELVMAAAGENNHEEILKCKFCSEEFCDDRALGTHWMESHNKEAQWLFRGYACAICLDSFTNRSVLETHVQERHHAQFVEHCMLFQCVPCGSHFGNSEELWSHVRSVHTNGFRQSKAVENSNLSVGEESEQKPDLRNPPSMENNSENQVTVRKYICRFCGLKFDLLPDLGRHHQAAHMGPNLVSSRPSKKGLRFYAYRLKSGRLSRPRFRKGLGGASYRLKNKVTAGLKKWIPLSNSFDAGGASMQSHLTEAAKLGGLTEFQCLDIAKILCSEAQKTKARPNNHDILSIARSSCCKVSLQASLEEKYGVLPERLYLKAAKLCSEHNIQVAWHQEQFTCRRGCQSLKEQNMLSVSVSPLKEYVGQRISTLSDPEEDKWEMEECHYVIDSRHLRHKTLQTTIILCNDISFGQEPVPIACVIDKNLMDSLQDPSYGFDGQITFMPWESFNYVIKPQFHQSLDINLQSLQLGCGCAQSTCCPERCDHVYLFNNDYEDAKDIYGKPMQGRFPYDEKGLLILEDGYLVYECNDICSCGRKCPNRILQNGLQLKLEVFKTEKKGWAVRASEPILHGTFVCEFLGEVLNEQESNVRRKRYGKGGCNYLFDVESCMSDIIRLNEEQVSYVIDATQYGNISRFINHSCSPNLVNRVVLVESMETPFAHIGLYARRDIVAGEELTFDYRHGLQLGKGCPCLCGALTCRGQLC